MKPVIYVATLLFLSSLPTLRSTAQTATPQVIKVGCSEYRAFYLCDNKKVYAVQWSSAINANAITQYDMDNKSIVDLAGGLYHGVAVDAEGYAWNLSNNKALATKITVDYNGNPFTGNIQCDAYFHTDVTVKSDGTLWYWGNDDYNLFSGTGVLAAPMPLTMPAGVKFKKVSCGRNLLALTTSGEVYEYVTGNPTPVKKTLPKPASDIASGNGFSVAIVPDNIATDVAGWPYGWGPDGNYFGYVNKSAGSPVALKAEWGLSLPIKKITANHNVIHFIDTDGNLWGLGDNAIGEVGIGEEKVNHAETYVTPYIWDWARNGMMITKPVHIAQGKLFKDLFTGGSYAFYHYAIATDNTIYSWGRNKTLALGNGKAINQEAIYPNALDVLAPTLVDPMRQSIRVWDFKPYTIDAGINRTITLPQDSVHMNGKAVSSSGYTIASYKWTKVSGPSTFNIVDPADPNTAITGLGVGTYTFRLQMTDNNTGTISDSMIITVNPGGTPGNQAPVPKAGADQKKSLPDNSVSLDGSTSYDPDGTIATWSWAKISGPAAFTITSPNTSKTTVTGLVEGIYNFELTVTDDKGASAKDVVMITITAETNLAPAARAGNDISIMLPANSISLDGSASSDQDGSIANWSWAKTSGPGSFTITSPGAAKTTVTGLVAGVYTFELTVTDDKGATAKDAVTVTVNPQGNIIPVAKAGNDISITLPANSVSLDGGASSDQDGSIASWSWAKISGPSSFNITSATAAQTTVTALEAGVYTFELTVTDDKGATAKDVVMVTVIDATNIPPVAKAGNDLTITIPTNSVSLDGSASSDPDGSIANWSWVKTAGPASYSIASPATAKTSITGLVPGTYTFELTVTDNKGAAAKDVVIVNVIDATNIPPVAKAGNDLTITLPTNSVSLDGSASSDPDGSIAGWSWVKTAGPASYSISSPATAKTSITGLVPGTYTFELTVTDNKGASAKDVVMVTVIDATNLPPVAKAGNDLTITLPTNSVSLDGSASSDPDGSIASWSWVKTAGPASFTIASPASAQTSITGLVAGVYTFELTVTDNKGATAKAAVTVTVNQKPNELPVAKAGNDVATTTDKNDVALDGSASYDPDGTIVNYSWVKISGPSPFTMTNPTTVRPTLVGLLPGVYELELTVTDDRGGTAKDRVIVTVQGLGTPDNKAPVANAGVDQNISTAQTQLDGSGSTDADGAIQSYSWQQVSGPSNAVIGTPNGAQTKVSTLTAGAYEFELTVTDNKGARATDRVVVNVTKDGGHAEDSVAIYPVPVRSIATVKIAGIKMGQSSVAIYTSTGNLVYRREFIKSSAVQLEEVDMTHMQAGTYVVVIQTPENDKITKIISKL